MSNDDRKGRPMPRWQAREADAALASEGGSASYFKFEILVLLEVH